MTYLYQALSGKIDAWRDSNYPCDDYPAIREILEFAIEDEETHTRTDAPMWLFPTRTPR